MVDEQAPGDSEKDKKEEEEDVPLAKGQKVTNKVKSNILPGDSEKEKRNDEQEVTFRKRKNTNKVKTKILNQQSVNMKSRKRKIEKAEVLMDKDVPLEVKGCKKSKGWKGWAIVEEQEVESKDEALQESDEENQEPLCNTRKSKLTTKHNIV
ncbi:hypothetical protein DFH28DRAFT_657280 [Melampsora americana]|nr:hypothetical protein DFH28DRAFT_657280 [Melampsora americana]